MGGILILNKPSGCSSHDMVYFTRRLLEQKKVGHTGTLDPIATGVLPILTGTSTKLCGILSNHDKKYRATLKLGLVTDTMDTTGNIIKQSDIIPHEDDVLEAVNFFVGNIQQIPPVYSAIKVNGKKLYEYAREGIEIKPEPRNVTVYSIEARKTDSREYELDISCSKGTYIRSLCNDIGERLGCGGVMSGLVRISSGDFDIKDSHTPQELEEIKEEKGVDYISSLLIPPEEALKKIISKRVILDANGSKRVKNGAVAYLSETVGYNENTKISAESIFNMYSKGDKVLMYDSLQNFFAIGSIMEHNRELVCKAETFL